MKAFSYDLDFSVSLFENFSKAKNFDSKSIKYAIFT